LKNLGYAFKWNLILFKGLNLIGLWKIDHVLFIWKYFSYKISFDSHLIWLNCRRNESLKKLKVNWSEIWSFLIYHHKTVTYSRENTRDPRSWIGEPWSSSCELPWGFQLRRNCNMKISELTQGRVRPLGNIQDDMRMI